MEGTPAMIPKRMQHLPLYRGMPVPVIVLWTDDGRPIFAANDEVKRQWCFDEDRCHICGGRLSRGRWFVSGQYSALAEDGQIMDGPMHDECCHHALKVCPYMAAPSYGRLVGDRQLASSDRKSIMVVDDPTRGLARPDVFVATMAVDQELKREPAFDELRGLGLEIVKLIRPKPGSVRKVEFWRHGAQVVDKAAIGEILHGVLDVFGRVPLPRGGQQLRIRADIRRLL